MNSFNYKYLLIPLVGVIFAGCMEEQEEGETLNHHLKVRVAYNQPEGNTRTATDTTQVVGTVWLDKDLCIEAKVGNWNGMEQSAQVSTPQTRGTLMEIPESIETLNLVMFKTEYNNQLAAIATFTVENKNKDGDFIITDNLTLATWPNDEATPRSFLSFAPKADGTILKLDNKSVIYTVPAVTNKQPDLLVSTFGSKKGEFNRDLVNAKGTYLNNLTLHMNHVLTAVGFEAVGWDLKITSVTLSNINNKGTISLENRTWSSLSGTELMTSIVKDDNWMQSNNKNEMGDITKNDGYLMMIPQTLNANAKLTITFEGKNGQPGGKYEVPLASLVNRWEPGKKIIYQLRLKTRPAVRTDKVFINNFQGGYTNDIPLEVVADADDNLTFTWDKPWLKIHRGAPGYVNPAVGGATSGWKTGINNWKNLFFFTTDDNASVYSQREATVTVSGKKSGTRTFKVTQYKKWMLRLQNEGTTYIRTFRPGTMSNANYAWIEGDVPATITYSIQAEKLGNGPGDRDWITVNSQKKGDNVFLSFNHKWNVHANKSRSATVTVTATYGNHKQSKNFKVEQFSSSYFIALDNNSNFQFAFYAYDLGTYWADERRCGHQGTRLLYIHEFRNTVGPGVVKEYWVNNANFKHTSNSNYGYWSSTEAKNIFGKRFDYFWFGKYFNAFGTAVQYRKNISWYRCVQPDQWAVY